MSFRNILIVDGNLDAAQQLSRGLRLLGYHVESVPTGSAALSVARGADFDVGIISELLPDGDGAECFHRLLSLQRHMRGVLLTAAGNLAVVWKAIEAGMQRVITRPVDFSELLPVVEAAPSQRPADISHANNTRTFDEASIAALSSEAIRYLLSTDELVAIIRSVDFPFAGKDRLPYFDRDTLERVVHLIRRWCQSRCSSVVV